MREKTLRALLYAVVVVFGFAGNVNAQNEATPDIANTPAGQATQCNNEVDFESTAIEIHLSKDGTGKFKVKNAEGPYNFIINTTAVNSILFDDEGESFTLKAVKDNSLKIRDKNGIAKIILLSESPECVSQDKSAPDTFKFVSEGASMPYSAEINAGKIKAFAWGEANVFFVDAESQSIAETDITVKNAHSERLDYYSVSTGRFKVSPEGDNIHIQKLDSRTFTLTGGIKPYHVISSNPSVIKGKSSFTDGVYIIDSPSVAGAVRLDFMDSGTSQKSVDIIIDDIDIGSDFATDRFMFNLGTIILNPYIISKDDTGQYIIDVEDVDTRYFFEILFKNRQALLDEPEGNTSWFPDTEFRMGIGSDNSEDPEGNSASGSGSVYGEFSGGFRLYERNLRKNCKSYIGLLFPLKRFGAKDCIANDPSDPANDYRTSLNAEMLFGFTSDKGYPRIHKYYGYGLVFVYSVPSKRSDKRRTDVIFGAYKGRVSVPVLKDDDATAVQSDDGIPMFRDKSAYIVRGDARFPIFTRSFMTFSGRYFMPEDSKVEPWSFTVGLSVRADKLAKVILDIFEWE